MLLWLVFGPGLGVVAGAGFLVAAAINSAAADTYRAALPCQQPGADPGNCYKVRAGVIQSVHVSQSRRGEEDDVVLSTQAGSLKTTLLPSPSEARHVRSGASATAKLYKGNVTAVFVEGVGVPSLASPTANQSEYQFYGVSLLGLSLLFLGVPVILTRWRRQQVPGISGTARQRPPPQLTTVPGGGVGTMVAPRIAANMWSRFGVVLLVLLVVSARWLLVPDLTPRVLAFDGALVAACLLSIWLFLHNSRLFVDGDILGRVDLLGRMSRFPPGSIDRAVRFSVIGQGGTNPYLSFVGSGGRELFKVSGRYWDLDQLVVLSERAAVPVAGSYGDMVGALHMNRRIPGSLRWGRQLALTVAIMAMVIAFVALVSGPSTR